MVSLRYITSAVAGLARLSAEEGPRPELEGVDVRNCSMWSFLLSVPNSLVLVMRLSSAAFLLEPT